VAVLIGKKIIGEGKEQAARAAIPNSRIIRGLAGNGE
jgi:hypothetical protein